MGNGYGIAEENTLGKSAEALRLRLKFHTADDAATRLIRPTALDHMGNVDGTLGADQPGVQQMCRLLGEGKIWVKVSGSYRVSTQYPDYPDAKPIHEALVRANPDQIIWGSDWPHPRMEKDMPEDGHLLDLFNAWTPDAGLRKKILVDNPQGLYCFE